MKSKNAAPSPESRKEDRRADTRREQLHLDLCYGAIGISAVAAALPYQSQVKNPAYAPVTWQPVWWAADMAA